MDRLVSSDAVERWMSHLRRQRSRANDTIWLIEKGHMLFEGRKGEPIQDATARWLAEQKQVVEDVNMLTALYHDEDS